MMSFMMVVNLSLLVTTEPLVFLLTRISGNLTVNNYQLVHNTLQHLTLLRSNTSITSILVLVQLVKFITHSTWQTGTREKYLIQMKSVILLIQPLVISIALELLQLEVQQLSSMQIQPSTEQLLLHQ